VLRDGVRCRRAQLSFFLRGQRGGPAVAGCWLSRLRPHRRANNGTNLREMLICGMFFVPAKGGPVVTGISGDLLPCWSVGLGIWDFSVNLGIFFFARLVECFAGNVCCDILLLDLVLVMCWIIA
jgi:hypothetical protein